MKKTRLLIAMLVMAAVLAISAFATVSIDFNVEEASTDTGMDCYKVVVTQTDDEGDWRALQTKISFNYDKIIPIDWYEGIVPSYSGEEAEYPFVFSEFKNSRNGKAELQRPQVPVWTINGADSEVIVELYWSAFTSYAIHPSETVIYEMYFKLADGVTLDDLAHDDFDVYYVKYANGVDNYYGNADETKNNMVLTNKVVPEAPVAVPVTVPVLAGDKVYLQDGSVVVVEAAGDYEVPATAGYVVVNTAKSAQKTYYVDGTSAVAVHSNALYGDDLIDLRAKEDDADRNGLRFRTLHNAKARNVENHVITEVGFIMAAETEKFTAKYGADYELTVDMLGKKEDGRTYAKKGIAFGVEDGKNVNKVFGKGTESIENWDWDLRAVFYNIPASNYETTIATRPYYMIGETVVYGEVSKMSLYEAAVAIKDGGYAGCDDVTKAYVDSIIEEVDGVATPVVDDEVIIDIGSLYE